MPGECHRVSLAVLDSQCPLSGNKYAEHLYFHFDFEFVGMCLDKLAARGYLNSEAFNSTHL